MMRQDVQETMSHWADFFSHTLKDIEVDVWLEAFVNYPADAFKEAWRRYVHGSDRRQWPMPKTIKELSGFRGSYHPPTIEEAIELQSDTATPEARQTYVQRLLIEHCKGSHEKMRAVLRYEVQSFGYSDAARKFTWLLDEVLGPGSYYFPEKPINTETINAIDAEIEQELYPTTTVVRFPEPAATVPDDGDVPF